MRTALLAAMLVASPAAAETSRTWIDVPGLAAPGWFLCDGIDAPFVAMVGRADVAGASRGALRIALLDKNRPAVPPTVRPYRLGTPDPGAGQVYWPLLRSGREAGNLHAFNPGAYDPAAVRMPPFTSVALGAARFQCRWRANSRLIAIAARRSLLVREEAPGRLVYESFDYSARPPVEQPDGVQRTTRPSQRVAAGRETESGGTTTFRFVNGVYGYAIIVPSTGAAVLTVTRSGTVIGREKLLAYTFAPR